MCHCAVLCVFPLALVFRGRGEVGFTQLPRCRERVRHSRRLLRQHTAPGWFTSLSAGCGVNILRQLLEVVVTPLSSCDARHVQLHVTRFHLHVTGPRRRTVPALHPGPFAEVPPEEKEKLIAVPTQELLGASVSPIAKPVRACAP